MLVLVVIVLLLQCLQGSNGYHSIVTHGISQFGKGGGSSSRTLLLSAIERTAERARNASLSLTNVPSILPIRDINSISILSKSNGLHLLKKFSACVQRLFILIVPIISKAFQNLRYVIPLSMERIMQYVQPLNVGLLIATSHTRGMTFLRTAISTVLIASIAQMAKDTFQFGALWLPVKPLEDSYALITGASSGLGKSMAQKLFEKGYNVILVGRNETVLERVREEFEHGGHRLPTETSQNLGTDPFRLADENNVLPSNNAPITDIPASTSILEETIPQRQLSARNALSRKIEIIPADFSNPLSAFGIMHELKRRGLENKIDILVANAGRGLYGRVHESSWSEIREHLEVNVASTVSLMRLLSPRMILRRRQLQNDGLVNSNPSASGGRILVISSAAGVGPGADIALYAATKAFLTTFALSLRRELLSEGILVSVATPGPLLGTNFLSKVRNMKHVPISFRLPVLAMGVDTAADQIIRGMIMGREIVSPGFLAKFYVHIVAKLLPSSLISVGVQNLWKPIPNIRLLAKKSKKLHSKQSNVVQRGDEEMTSQHTIRKSRLSQHRPFLKSKLSQWNPLMKLRKRWIPKWNIFGTKISKYEIEESFLREMKQLQLSEEEAEVAALRNTYVYMDSSDVSREKLVEEVPTPIVSLENEF